MLALIAAFLSSMESDRADAENKELLTKLQRRNEDVINLQTQSLDFWTGKDSKFYVKFGSHDGKPTASFRVQGPNPARDVLLTIFSFMEDADSKEPTKKTVKIGDVFPDSPLGLKSFGFPKNGNAKYFIVVTQSNGHHVQIVSMKRASDGTPLFAHRVMALKKQDGEFTFDPQSSFLQIDPGFPANGEPELSDASWWQPYL